MDKIKILLVDDEVDFLEVMGARIEGWGYDVVKALNGKEAMASLIDKKPDMVILDYMLPDMDGVTVLKRIRKVNKVIPVIMFTAYPNVKAMGKTEKLGISAYIPKVSADSDVLESLKSSIEMTVKRLGKKG